MEFSVTYDEVLFLYPYYSLNEKNDETSKAVYHVFKKGWNWDTFFPLIEDDMLSALMAFVNEKQINPHRIAITIMPSHLKGTYGEGLLRLAECLSCDLECMNASHLIQRTVDKVKSTEGGVRAVGAHLQTLGLATEIDDMVDLYIVLDDITTTGSSLEAARQLLIKNGVSADSIIKIAVAKTMHD